MAVESGQDTGSLAVERRPTTERRLIVLIASRSSSSSSASQSSTHYDQATTPLLRIEITSSKLGLSHHSVSSCQLTATTNAALLHILRLSECRVTFLLAVVCAKLF